MILVDVQIRCYCCDVFSLAYVASIFHAVVLISFPAIKSREESSAMGERRLGWNEEGSRHRSLYIGGSSCRRGKKYYP
jgi:hypothetical protein